jgi:hypothetical protein
LEATTTTTRDDTFLLGARLPVTAKQIKKGERHSSLQEEKKGSTPEQLLLYYLVAHIFLAPVCLFSP